MTDFCSLVDRFTKLKRITNNISIPFSPKSDQLFKKYRRDTIEDEKKCHILSYGELHYTMDKPIKDWETRKKQEVDVFSIHRILSTIHEHMGKRIWIENVYIKLLCFNNKSCKQTFEVYKRDGLSLLCSMPIKRFKRQNVGILFIYKNNNNVPITEVLKAWNAVLKSLKFNVQVQLTQKGCSIIKLETLSIPVYDLCINPGVNNFTTGMKWRVPNTKESDKNLEFLEIEASKNINLLKAKSLHIEDFKFNIYQNSKSPQVLGPVDLEILKFSITTECAICFATCQRYSKIKKKSRKVKSNSIEIPHFKIKVCERNNEHILDMFAIVNETYMNECQDIKLKTGDLLRAVYIKVQLSSLLTKEWDQKPQFQIMKMWYPLVNNKKTSVSCQCNNYNCEFNEQ